MAEQRNESEVREHAYKIWEAEGRPDGRAEEHWERAQQALGGKETSPKSKADKAEKGAEGGKKPGGRTKAAAKKASAN